MGHTSRRIRDLFIKNNPNTSNDEVILYLMNYYENSEFVHVYLNCFDCMKSHGIGTFEIDIRREDYDKRVLVEGYLPLCLDYKCPRGHVLFEEYNRGCLPLDEAGYPFCIRDYLE